MIIAVCHHCVKFMCAWKISLFILIDQLYESHIYSFDWGMQSNRKIEPKQFHRTWDGENLSSGFGINLCKNLGAQQECLAEPTRPMTWWHHQMETFSTLLAICAGNSPVSGEFPAQRPVTRTFDVFFDLRLNRRLNKQWWGWWFETPLCSLWRHRNGSCHCISMG